MPTCPSRPDLPLYIALHDELGRGQDTVMHRLEDLRRRAHALPAPANAPIGA